MARPWQLPRAIVAVDHPVIPHPSQSHHIPLPPNGVVVSYSTAMVMHRITRDMSSGKVALFVCQKRV